MPMPKKIKLNFTDEWFNDVFFKIREAKTRFLILFGGSSAGKSYAKHQDIILKTFEGNHRQLIIRKYGTDLKESSYQLCLDIINEWRLNKYFKFTVAPLTITNIYTGAKIIFRGLDDTEKIKSIARIKYIDIDEASELEKADFRELNRRVRGIENIQITFIFNPVLETHWLKKTFFDDDLYSPQTTIIHCTYQDNLKFLTQSDIEQFELLKKDNYNDYLVYALGEWGRIEIERPYAYNFEYDKHVKPCEHIPEYQHAISIDFNVDPLVCELISFHAPSYGGRSYYHYDEISIKSGDVFELADRIKAKVPMSILLNTVFTGDATGNKREVSQRDNLSNWQILQKELYISPHRLHVKKSNPSVKQNRTLVNAILARHVDFRVDPKCEILIRELQYTEADHEGNLVKTSRSKEAQRADALDCLRYGVNTWLYRFLDKKLYL